jgi:peptidoglycan/xylan/chitin deacetylase (PgdA/CDA1 family)
VTVDHDGLRRTVRVGGHPTVQAALAAAGIRLVSAHLLAVDSRRPIAGHDLWPSVLVDGAPAGPATPLTGRHQVVQVIDARDRVEPVVVGSGELLPAAPLPRVLRSLWHRGHPGVADRATVGAVSGEVVSSATTTQPSPATPVTDKVVALSFDDGPWPDTPQFLAVLEQAGIKATFCMIGRQVTAHPEWVRQVAAAGMTLCNHTQNHNIRLDKAGADVVQAEIQGGVNAQLGVVGRPPSLYRPPGGALSALIEDDANRAGEQVLGWSVDPSDYKRPGTSRIVAAVMAQVRPGAIILLHDGGGDRSQTLAALPRIIAGLEAQGYTFTTPDAVAPTPLGAASGPAGEPQAPLGPEG